MLKLLFEHHPNLFNDEGHVNELLEPIVHPYMQEFIARDHPSQASSFFGGHDFHITHLGWQDVGPGPMSARVWKMSDKVQHCTLSKHPRQELKFQWVWAFDEQLANLLLAVDERFFCRHHKL